MGSTGLGEPLGQIPAARRALWIGLLTMVASLYWYCPRFAEWTFVPPYPAETYRAVQFLRQCDSPLAGDVDSAVKMRLLLPVFCHFAGLRGSAALAVPWIGVLLLASSVPFLLLRRGFPQLDCLLINLLLGSTSAFLVSTGWLGINDAWVWAGLCAIALGASDRTCIAACLLLPWVDERFVIGLPLALGARTLCAADPGQTLSLRQCLYDQVRFIRWLVVYFLIRWLLGRFLIVGSSEDLLLWIYQHLHEWIRPMGYGWWNGLRLGWLWVPICAALAWKANGPLVAGTYSAVVLATIVVSMILAKDLSRSAAIIAPVMLAGIAMALRQFGTEARWLLLATIGGNFILPVAHCIGNRIMPISHAPFYLGWWR